MFVSPRLRSLGIILGVLLLIAMAGCAEGPADPQSEPGPQGTQAEMGATATPTPAPVVSAVRDSWLFFGPECPGAYSNCAPNASERQFITLESLRGLRDPSVILPSFIAVGCSPYANGPDFTFYPEDGTTLPSGAAMSVEVGKGDPVVFSSGIVGSYGISLRFWADTSGSIIELIGESEALQATLQISVAGESIVESFDVTGFSTNHQRLDC